MNNLIKNPNFENFIDLPGMGAGKLAEHWTLDYNHGKRRPEAREGSVPPADDWEGAQQFFSTKDLMDAWILQRVYVSKAVKGKTFVFGAKVALKSVDAGDGIGEYYVAIGVDRWGETDPRRKTAQWTTPKHQAHAPKWTDLEIRVPIEGDTVTVYVQADNKYRVDGSLFIKSVYGYVVDDPCDGIVPPAPDPDPQPEPDPDDDDATLTDISRRVGLVLENQMGIMTALGKTLKRGDVL